MFRDRRIKLISCLCLTSVLPVTTCVSYALLRYFHMNEEYVKFVFLLQLLKKSVFRTFAKQNTAML